MAFPSTSVPRGARKGADSPQLRRISNGSGSADAPSRGGSGVCPPRNGPGTAGSGAPLNRLIDSGRPRSTRPTTSVQVGLLLAISTDPPGIETLFYDCIERPC